MDSARFQGIASLIASGTGEKEVCIKETRSLSGGCIHFAELVLTVDGRSFFVKSNQQAGEMFAQEAYALSAMQRVGVIRIPQVVAVGMIDPQTAALVLEAIERGSPGNHFWSDFGSSFARFHKASALPTDHLLAGWPSDNYIGSNPQPNRSCANWVDFFAEQRLTFQLRLARNHSLGSTELFQLTKRLVDRLDRYLDADHEPLTMLHGDLWSGNYLIDLSGSPVLIDPASYYGHREADLAMPLLFGGFPDEFFEGYNAAWRLQEGWRERVEIYKLYHMLNHLNLFGTGYLDGCLEILRRFA